MFVFRPPVSPFLPASASAALFFGVLACPAADEPRDRLSGAGAGATAGITSHSTVQTPEAAPVPEPSLVHLGMSLFGFCLLLRRRR
ncbi:hypothetical protein [Luteolibacter luteus]|uniref:PEP-CTERM sorting domain-containing protein n=1 Tax=Luteolibacter luteus TaxID=2728835 RepID=A0A858RPW7_9BACT|nr:hypothetical protein [Luteolibacter luteus]QJE99077.1 hypothetical protein HHL09_25960 [Luteolibacter luteus]